MAYTSSDYSLPLLLCIHAAIRGDRDEDALFDVGDDEAEVVGEEGANDFDLTDDEEAQELVDVMEDVISSGINDDVDNGTLNSTDDEDHDGEEDEEADDDASFLSAHSGDVENASGGGGGGDMTSGLKRRFEAHNEEAGEIDWRREDGYLSSKPVLLPPVPKETIGLVVIKVVEEAAGAHLVSAIYSTLLILILLS